MLKDFIKKRLDPKQKLSVKAKYMKAKKAVVKSLYSYGPEELRAALRKAGVEQSDTLFVHSNFKQDSGFKGSPLDMANAFADLVVPGGNLLMVSIPFRGTAYDHLEKGKTFHQRRSISMMGLVTEMFRRKKGVRRSLHPTHPVLAFGKDAEWIVEGHERCLYPCGPGSPFEKFRKLDGKILFYDVDFGAITFFHHVEHLTKDLLPFPVYSEEVFEVKAVDTDDREHSIRTYAFSREPARDAHRLEEEMKAAGKIKTGSVGNSSFQLVTARDVVECQTAMIKAGRLPYRA